MRLFVLTIAITLHEFGHAITAVWCGDPTPKEEGRVTLDPLAHLDPIGSIAIVLVGFGWGRPVMVNPSNFRKPRRDDILVSSAGPAMNFLLAILAGLFLRFARDSGIQVHEFAIQFAVTSFYINILLAVFNLIPVGPLDGAHVVRNLLPLQKAYMFSRFNQQWGWMLLFIVLISPASGYVLNPVYRLMSAIVIGSG